MNSIVLILSGIFGVVLSQPQNVFRNPFITRYNFDIPFLGSYSFGFDTSDGSRHDQTGQTRNAGSKNEILAVEGSYSYIGPDGKTYKVDYIADEGGFQPMGAHLPPSAGVRKLGAPPAKKPAGDPDKKPKKPISSTLLGSLVGGGLS